MSKDSPSSESRVSPILRLELVLEVPGKEQKTLSVLTFDLEIMKFTDVKETLNYKVNTKTAKFDIKITLYDFSELS